MRRHRRPGGGFESLTVGTATATANVTDTVTTATVNLTASTVDEGAGVDYVFTATLSDASHGVTTIHTDQGDITIADGPPPARWSSPPTTARTSIAMPPA